MQSEALQQRLMDLNDELKAVMKHCRLRFPGTKPKPEGDNGAGLGVDEGVLGMAVG